MTQLVRPAAGSSETAAADREAKLRDRLGIPADAKRVLLFSESSHWDTNWLKTSDEYFDERLRPIFSAILKALEQDPSRVYCIESVFFLKLFWERHPEEQERLRSLLERRQLRVLTSSFTTPDTLLPHPEAILRDFHLGQQWLHAQGLSSVPRTAYFPDNFGHSPHLPSLMRAVGVDSVALTRIDGMYFIASDFRRKSAFPLKGSTAEVLQKDLRTLDFVWRDDDGAEVLCHWNAFTYFQGDMLAHAGIVRWSGLVAAIPWRTRGHIARRIDGFVRQLEPVSRTPYMLCPIGMDFNDPIDRLPELLHRYNHERFGSTGTWALLAGMDDYFELVGHHSARLPVLSVDPNPYWMGFYASRPELKQRSTRLTRELLLAEALSALEAREASSRSGAPRRVAQPGADEPPRRDHGDVSRSHLPRGAPRLARHRRSGGRQGPGALGGRRGRWIASAGGAGGHGARRLLARTGAADRDRPPSADVLEGARRLSDEPRVRRRGAASRPGPRSRRLRRRGRTLASRARVPGRKLQGSRPSEPSAGPHRGHADRRRTPCRHRVGFYAGSASPGRSRAARPTRSSASASKASPRAVSASLAASRWSTTK